MLANKIAWIRTGQGLKVKGLDKKRGKGWGRNVAVKPGKAGAMRSLRGPHPESRPLLKATEGAAARVEQGSQHPTWPRRAAQDSPSRPPPPRHARPLTFTFPVLRRPSCPRRHQRTPHRGEVGRRRTRASPAIAGVSLWPR